MKKSSLSANLMKGGIVALVVVALIAILSAQFHSIPEGEKLEEQLWANMKSKNWKGIEDIMSSAFQSVHSDGPRDGQGEMELIKNLKLVNYKLINFNITQS